MKKSLNKIKNAFFPYGVIFYDTIFPNPISGFSFDINSQESLDKLHKVFSNKYFRGVIVTQKFAKDFLIDNKYCRPEQIKFIFGGIIPQCSSNNSKEIFYNRDKKTLDICFCTAKYMDRGLDKGCDLFIEDTHILQKRHENINFHAVGEFGANDIDASQLGNRISFYGCIPYDRLAQLTQRINFLKSLF